MSTAQLLRAGLCRCHEEPRGRAGLEGYDQGSLYRFELMLSTSGSRYVRVYPGATDGPARGYYETCGPQVFTRFFEELPE